jgi:hypothetical protein
MTKVKNPFTRQTPSLKDNNVAAKKISNSTKSSKKVTKKGKTKNINKNINENSYFTRQLEEIKIEELLLANETQISIVSGPSSCGKTELIQNALQTLDIDYIVLETDDFKNNETLYNTLKFQISPSISGNRSGRGSRNGRGRISSSSTIDDETILELLKSIPEEIPIIIDDAFSLFNYVNEVVEDDNSIEENELSLKINPIIFEWIYNCLETDKKLNMILVSSNPLVECWIDINIPNEIVCYCPIRDLTYDEAQDFYYSYLYNEGIDAIDLKFEDVYPITGTRLSIIKDFIQEYIHRPYEDFNELDFSTLNKVYSQLNNLLDSSEQPQLLKRIMAIMVSESDRGYVEEKELEYIFQNNQGFETNEEKLVLELDEEDVDEEEEEDYRRSLSSSKKNKKAIGPGSDDFWEIIAMLIENHLLNRTIMEFTSPEPLLPSSISNRQHHSLSSTNDRPVIIKRPVLFPENQCVLYAMNMILKENNITIGN